MPRVCSSSRAGPWMRNHVTPPSSDLYRPRYPAATTVRSDANAGDTATAVMKVSDTGTRVIVAPPSVDFHRPEFAVAMNRLWSTRYAGDSSISTAAIPAVPGSADQELPPSVERNTPEVAVATNTT